jgi:hypothetical protein
MELAEILARIEGRLSTVGLSASKASRQAGKPDAIRNMQRVVREGRQGSVTVETISALAPVLRTTTEWLLTGQGKQEADELLELLPADKLNPLTDVEVTTSMAWAFRALEDAITEAEARILARAIVRAIRMPVTAEADKRALIETAVRLFSARQKG